MTTAEYQALAEFRFLIRRYVNSSEKAARSVGLEPQQYQALLALRGLRDGQLPTIRTLADRLQILHHSAVELVDRMQRRGLFRRERLKDDRRHVLVYVTPRGEKLLSRLVRHRLAELRITAPGLVLALNFAMGTSPASANDEAVRDTDSVGGSVGAAKIRRVRKSK
jgi:DNA-binding MarR family transcriptional regulator